MVRVDPHRGGSRCTCRRATAAAVLGAMLLGAGCASKPREDHGVQWVVESQAERDRLERAGFPQGLSF